MRTENVPVEVSVTIKWNGRVQTRIASFDRLSPDEAGRESTYAAVRSMIRTVAESAAEPYAAAMSAHTDSLFANQVPEAKRSRCAKPYPSSEDYNGNDDQGYDPLDDPEW